MAQSVDDALKDIILWAKDQESIRAALLTSIRAIFGANDFLSDAPYAAKCIWRGELLPAKWCLDYDMKHKYLLKMLEWHAGMDHQWSVPVRNLGKGLKKLLPPDIWDALEQTFVGAGLEENWIALENTMALFRRVAIDVGSSLGYPYPDDLHHRVRIYVDHIRKMA